MENEYIIEGNKLIAEFEGWKESNNFLPYNISWGWLMPVVEKIIKKHMTDYYNEYDMSYPESYFVTIGSDGKYCSQGTSKNSLIEATWIAVVEFIKWYNNEQINNNR